MQYEKSCGAVVFTNVNGERKFLLVSNLEGIYGFPKGHVEAGETETETALREVFEETNLKVRFLGGFKTVEEHPIPTKIDTIKQIVYFLGYYEHQEVIYQKEELSDARLVSFNEAMALFQFESSKRILKEANDWLNTNGEGFIWTDSNR